MILNVGELRPVRFYKRELLPVASGSLEGKFNVRVVIKSFRLGVLVSLFIFARYV
jgi:hypothetical protein